MTSKRFSRAFLEAFGDWTTYVLNLMEHKDWRVTLKDEVEMGHDAAASMDFTYGRKLASLKLAQDFFDSTEEQMEHYWLHELCHIYLEPLDTVVQNTQTSLGIPAHTIMFEWFKSQMEITVDTLAYAIGSMLSHDDEYNSLLRRVFETAQGELPEPDTES